MPHCIILKLWRSEGSRRGGLSRVKVVKVPFCYGYPGNQYYGRMAAGERANPPLRNCNASLLYTTFQRSPSSDNTRAAILILLRCAALSDIHCHLLGDF